MAMTLEHVTYIYDPDVSSNQKAIDDICLEIPDNQFIAVIGHTGSGKSTLIQHLNGLLRPTSGHVYYEGKDIWADGYPIHGLRSEVGLVFQYPEHQLFEETVLKDVCFGPKNQGYSPEEAKKLAREALKMVGLDKSYEKMSPFELSGGQKRRAAIAGVLAMRPKILILDEPTAGLDPLGRDEILDRIAKLQRETHITVILVSHSMEDVARYAERIIVIDDGKIKFDKTPKEVFRHYRELEQMGLSAPQVTYLAYALRRRGFDISADLTTVEEAKNAILKLLLYDNNTADRNGKDGGEKIC